jgi:hypothetical protein
LLEVFLITCLDKGSSDIGKVFIAVDDNFLCCQECLFAKFGFYLSFGYLEERFAWSDESSICRAVSMADAKFSAVGCALAISMSAFARR